MVGGEARRPDSSDSYDDLTELFELMRQPGQDVERLREKIVVGALPLAEHIATRFRGRGESHDDLVQVARLGLVNAVDRFDVDRGTDFVGYAVPTIMGEIRHHFRDVGWAMRVPRKLKDRHVEITKAVPVLSQRLGRAPTAREIAKELDISPEEVADGLLAGSAYNTVSMNATGDREDDTPLLDTLGAEDPAIADVENFASLAPALANLPDRERTVLTLRFFGSMTQTQIAERMGISQMHVSRLLAKTLAELRAELED